MEAYSADRSLRGKLRRRYTRLAFRKPLRLSLDRPMVTFSFDDVPASAALAGARVLEALSLRGTFYICAGLEDGEGPMGRYGSSEDARRLAATHGVIPAVLGGKSEVLDVGRKKRLFTRAQRVAMALRQGGLCNRQGCDVPAAWCDANHRTDWAKGGTTSIDDAELVCPHDHTLHHQGVDFPRRT